MPIVNTKEVLQYAKENKYALGAFNVASIEAIRGIIAAAEEANSPVIMEFAESHLGFVPLDIIGPVMVREAEKATVPVVVHFDHGKDVDLIAQALELGFSSVMIDGADLPYDENVELTKKVVGLAHSYGATVEAELGTMGNPETSGETNDELIHSEAIYTDPKVAADFVEKTNVDLLAVSFGTAHGLYIAKPKLDYKRLDEIAKSVSVPLVMHGGSGLSEEEYKKSIYYGVTKINYYSDLAHKVAVKAREKLNEAAQKNIDTYSHDISLWTIDIVKEDVMDKMQVFGSTGQAERGECK